MLKEPLFFANSYTYVWLVTLAKVAPVPAPVPAITV